MPSSCSLIPRRSASCPSWQSERRAAFAVIVAVAAVLGCGKERLKIAQEDPNEPNDYNRTKFLQAAAAASRAKTPAAFRALAVRARELDSTFSESVKVEVERVLVFMALPPMLAVFDRPPLQQQEALALTVWPTALGVEPNPGESPAAFVERICGDKLALKCKYAVAEYRPVLLNALAWRNLKDRAREAYTVCDVCANDPEYRNAVDSYSEHDRIMTGRAGNIEDRAHPSSWPIAGKAARPWSEVPVLAVDLDGEASFRGLRTSAGKWRDAIARSTPPSEPLGVYLRPKDRIRTLRAVLADAAAVGYREIALQVRERTYPFRLREYRLVTNSKATRNKPTNAERTFRKVMVRDIDTIQVLVQSLDANASSDGTPLAI